MNDALVGDLWAQVEDLKALERRYETEAKARADVALALARVGAMEGDESGVVGAWREEGSVGLALPLVMARLLVAPEPGASARRLYNLRFVMTPESASAIRKLLDASANKAATLRASPKTKDEGDKWALVEVRCAAALARLGDPKPAEALLPTQPNLGSVLLRYGIGVDHAIAAVARGATDEGEVRNAAAYAELLAEAGIREAVPAILSLVRSAVAIHALAALATLRDPRGVDAARKILKETCGNAWDVNILRLAAEHVLRQHGEKPPLDLARASIDWPIADYRTTHPEAMRLRQFALEALALHGDERDKERVRMRVRSGFREVRDAAKKAFATPPSLVAWDDGRVAWATAKKGNAPLLEALEDPHAIYLDTIVRALAKDEKAMSKVVPFFLRQFDERMAYPFSRRVELDDDLAAFAEVARSLKGPARKAIEASTNIWVRTRILREEEPREVAAYAPGARAAEVTRFDAPPYWFPGLTRVALAEGAERAVVVAEDVVLFDPQASTRLATLGSGAGVTAVAIAADGALVAVGRGPKLELRSGTDASVVVAAEVAGTAAAMAFSPSGGWLACGTEEGGITIFDVATGKSHHTQAAPGRVGAAVWLGPKRAVFLAAKGAKSVLVDVDVAKKKSNEVPVAPSTKLAARGKTLITAGGKKSRLHDAKLGTKLEVTHEANVVDVAVESEKSVIVALETKIQRARIGGKAPKFEDVSREKVACLAAAGERLYAPVDGTMVRFHQDPQGRVAEGVHFDHVTGIAPLPDGRIVTSSWDGRILLWPPRGGRAATLFDRKARVDAMALTPKADAVVIDDGTNVRLVDIASATSTCIVGGDDLEEDLAEHMPDVESVAATDEHVAWGDGAGNVHKVDRKTGEELWTTQVFADDVEWLVFDDAGRLYASSDKGHIACLESDGTVRWSRVEHGIDVLNGKLHGNPHRSCAHLSTRGNLLTSLASDHTVRVFEIPSGARTLRCFRDVGIFNLAQLSPSGERLAFSFGSHVEVVSMADGSSQALLDANTWQGARAAGEWNAEPQAVAWLDESTLLVGCESGAIYRVALGD